MTTSEIRLRRLMNQQIAKTAFTKPEEIVHWMGAMQAQDFGMAKWAIGLRLPGSKDIEIEEAFNQGRILRTHLLRPTWHFVAPADIRWLQQLTSPRVHALNEYYYKRNELDRKIVKKCHEIIAQELQKAKHLTRTQLQEALAKKKIIAQGERLAYIMMLAELDCLICSGPKLGKQFTYALLDEWVPFDKKIDRKEALGKLMNRFFTSRGPATFQDLAYWSSLTIKEINEGKEMLDKSLVSERVNGHEYIFIPSEIEKHKNLQTSFLMPDYDEYGMSYKDKSFMVDKKAISNGEKNNARLPHFIIMNGVVAGTWTFIKKTERRNKLTVLKYNFPASLSKAKQKTADRISQQYRSFTQP